MLIESRLNQQVDSLGSRLTHGFLPQIKRHLTRLSVRDKSRSTRGQRHLRKLHRLIDNAPYVCSKRKRN
jgi:hypothetical protein